MFPIKDQGQTKEERRNYPRTSKRKKCFLLRLCRFFSLSYTFPYSTERTPTDDRAKSDTTPCLQKVLFLKIAFLKKLSPFLKRFTPCCAFCTHLLFRFTPNKHKKCTFPQKKCIFLYILTSFSSLS